VTPRRPRSTPPLLHSRPYARRHSYRPPADPRRTKAKGIATLWTRVRRLLWSWWLWALLVVYLIEQREWWWAVGIAVWSLICSLSTPIEFPPQYGLDLDLEVRPRPGS
jgi:hypothetical protein